MSRVLVTGATGFVGRTVVSHLAQVGYEVVATLRSPSMIDLGVQTALVGEVGPRTDWRAALEGVDAVVHCAARAHVMREDSRDPRGAFMQTNAEGTARLADQAVAAGVGRFVLISSVSVYGLNSHASPVAEALPPSPRNAYGESKLAAERLVSQAFSGDGRGWVGFRPPLIHGPGAPGNLQRLLSAVRRGMPLPFGCVRNQRSLLGVSHLARLVEAALAVPSMPNEAINAADHETVSTAEIVRALAEGGNRAARLFPVPTLLLHLAARLTGRMATYQQLCESLCFDTTRLQTHYGVLQPVSTFDGLRATGASA